jgi:hypothetical protein
LAWRCILGFQAELGDLATKLLNLIDKTPLKALERRVLDGL